MALDDEPDDVYLARHRLQARAADDRLLDSLRVVAPRNSAAVGHVICAIKGQRECGTQLSLPAAFSQVEQPVA